jgi:hypothetical protein
LDARAGVVCGGLGEQYGFSEAATPAWDRTHSAEAVTRDAK